MDIDFLLLSAHELRTSLSAMKWLFKMLKDGDYGPLTPEQAAAIDQATMANEHMLTIITSSLTALKTGTDTAYATLPIHLETLLTEIIKEFTSEASQKHVALTYHQSAAISTIRGDESKLRIAIHNVIENAIKYSPANTEVLISLETNASSAVISVQDHGIGIPEEQKQHLFEKFFRAGNNTETGTGLGLYSSKVIIEHHGGTISLDSTEDIGTTVTVTLPLQA